MPYSYTALASNFAEIIVGTTIWGATRNTQLAGIIEKLNEVGCQLELTDEAIAGAVTSIAEHIAETTAAHNATAIMLSEEEFGESANVETEILSIRNVLQWNIAVPDVDLLDDTFEIVNSANGSFTLNAYITTEAKKAFIDAGGYIRVIFYFYNASLEYYGNVTVLIEDFTDNDGTYEGSVTIRYSINDYYITYKPSFGIVGRRGESITSDYVELIPFVADIDPYIDLTALAESIIDRINIVQDIQRVKVLTLDDEEVEIDVVQSTKVALRNSPSS